jgi:hypothetical protein
VGRFSTDQMMLRVTMEHSLEASQLRFKTYPARNQTEKWSDVEIYWS